MTAKQQTKTQPKVMLLPPPESFFVFVVGHCEEWPENREEQGDTAIYNEYLDFGVPNDQCVYIKDDDCTRKNCQKSLKDFLKRTASVCEKQPKGTEEDQPPKTLVFYYGGHGCANGFSTIGGTWAHRDVVRTIDKYFQGDRVLFLVDCCSSGSLWRHFPSASSESETRKPKEYVLLATSQPYIETSADGEEWILSNTWIQIMRRLCSDTNGEYSHYLGIEETISLLADRHVFQLGDLFFAYLTPTREEWSWIPTWNDDHKTKRKTSFQRLPWLKGATESPSDSDSSYQIPNEAKMLPVFDCRVGDAIAYKHPGGCPTSLVGTRSAQSPSSINEKKRLSFSVPPLWLNGTIVAIFENERAQDSPETDHESYSNIFFRIRVWYPSQVEPWEIEVSHGSPRLINHFFVVQTWMLPKSFLETQVVLAQKYQQYLDCSLAPNTPVQVALKGTNNGNSDAVLEGTVLDWRDFNWKQLLHSCTGTSPVTTEYDDFYWNELPVPIKRAAKILGYTKSSWDNDTGIPADSLTWDNLSRAQKDAASELGYARSTPASTLPRESNGSNKKPSWTTVSEVGTGSGPHIPVEWKSKDQPSIVPLKQILLVDETDQNLKEKSSDTMRIPKSPLMTTVSQSADNKIIFSQQDKHLIRGLESSGKWIRNAEQVFGTAELSAFWVEDESWYDAKPINFLCHDDINCIANKKSPLEDLLTSHFEYMLPGVYCPIEYDDGVRQLIPVSYIFRRGCYPQQQEDGDSENDSSNDLDSKWYRGISNCTRFCGDIYRWLKR